MKRRKKLYTLVIYLVLIMMSLPHVSVAADESSKVSIKVSNGRVRIVFPKTPEAENFDVWITEKERDIGTGYYLCKDGSQKRSLLIRGLYDGEYVVEVTAKGASSDLWTEKKVIKVKNKIDNSLKNVKPGDIITLGACNQDYELNNGMEPIEWIVLSVEGDKILVISEYILDLMPFDDNSFSATWESSSIRKWLNNDFYENAFSEAEKKCICETIIYNGINSDVDEGQDTKDKVFLLSSEEADDFALDDMTCSLDPSKNYWDGFYSLAYGKVTEYVKKQWDLENDKIIRWGDSESWWTRTCSSGNSKAWAIHTAAYTWEPFDIYETFTKRYYPEFGDWSEIIHGVRPAMYVNIEMLSNIKANEGNSTNVNNESLDSIVSNIKPGDIIKLGVQELDQYSYNYEKRIFYKNDPMEWRVLYVEGDKALLLSEYAVGSRCFNEEYNSTWKECSLRKWLNEAFYANHFSKQEQSIILQTTLDNSYYSEPYYVEDEYFEQNISEADTVDKIFLLSYDDVTNEEYGFPSIEDKNRDSDRICYSTYDKSEGVYWWLRNHATNEDGGKDPVTVTNCGYLEELNETFTAYIRPAMWISLK